MHSKLFFKYIIKLINRTKFLKYRKKIIELKYVLKAYSSQHVESEFPTFQWIYWKVIIDCVADYGCLFCSCIKNNEEKEEIALYIFVKGNLQRVK